jgi:hypothetical protein
VKSSLTITEMRTLGSAIKPAHIVNRASALVTNIGRLPAWNGSLAGFSLPPQKVGSVQPDPLLPVLPDLAAIEPDRVDGFLHSARRMRLEIREAEEAVPPGDDADMAPEIIRAAGLPMRHH